MSDLINVIQMELILHSIDFHTKSLEKKKKPPAIYQIHSFLNLFCVFNIFSFISSLSYGPLYVFLSSCACVFAVLRAPGAILVLMFISVLSVCYQYVPVYYSRIFQHTTSVAFNTDLKIL